ncbi:acetate kinase [Paraburkholderia silviterrae]|uniref:Acetate kinase n=1 Tax=Paraburkholderia silviterrae TaxID=2528715 RepID=A0A4R5M1M6_9BURK|nr:acetate kinase [Paraburkholderia silviterrae]TDG19247.1 acetate kinase [Paraburkholderia silviterrae]
MKCVPFRQISAIGYAALLAFSVETHAQSLETQAVQADQANIKELRNEVDQRIKELEALKRKLSDEEANFQRLSRSLDSRQLESKRATGGTDVNGLPVGTPATGGATAAAQAVQADQATQAAAPSNAQPGATAQSDQNAGSNAGNAAQGTQAQAATPAQPVGQAPVADTHPPAVAPIFDQPGVLTPRHTFVVEPYFQFSYASENQVSLVGYTIIPALLIGLINVNEVKTTTLTGGLAFRYGITNRMEFEVRVPYVYQTNDVVAREPFVGTAANTTISSSGHDIGDVEMTLRYQFNQGGPDKFYYIGWLRLKTATGKSPFDVVTDCVVSCVASTTANTGLPLQQPTGSGFLAIQPGLTWLFPSDPVVFFGNFSYLHSFGKDESLTLLNGQTEFLGNIQPGDIWGFNIGMGLSLNEKASVSIGYDQSIVLPTSQNGQTVPGSVRVILGTLLIGYSYRITPKTTLNFSIGAGLTRDTPDLTLTLRVPMSF